MERLNFNKDKVQASYKTIYLKDDTICKIKEIAYKNDTSFNNVVSSIINNYLESDVQL